MSCFPEVLKAGVRWGVWGVSQGDSHSRAPRTALLVPAQSTEWTEELAIVFI